MIQKRERENENRRGTIREEAGGGDKRKTGDATIQICYMHVGKCQNGLLLHHSEMPDWHLDGRKMSQGNPLFSTINTH
jgi:hypothetical protein